MYFITLEWTLAGILVTPPEQILEHRDLREAWKYSEAAAILHQHMYNWPERRPRWLTLHDVTGKPVFSDAAANEGMEILEYLSGWYKRHVPRRHTFFSFYSEHGGDPETEVWRAAHDQKYKLGTLGRSLSIGFDLPEVGRFLNELGVRFAYWADDDQLNQQNIRRLPQQGHLKQEIPPVMGGLANKTAKAEPHSEEHAAPKLTLPDKSDVWAKAIEATYEIMVLETGTAPSGPEVWLRMNDRPPANYPIKVTRDHGLAAIAMPGEKLLTRDGFLKRWGRYTGAK